MKYRIITIVGARPQIIKASAISRMIVSKFSGKLEEIIIHTGQHYDTNMSRLFFDELGIPKENYNLQVGSGSHAVQTARMMISLDEIIDKENPDGILLYGDTNSTVAAALVAVKKQIPVFHVEAGVRSFKKRNPEEVNRLIADHLSTLLFVPTKSGMDNLKNENIYNRALPLGPDNPKVVYCGDIMFDNTIFFKKKMQSNYSFVKEQKIDLKNFILVTIHRPVNTDNPEKLLEIFTAFETIAKEKNIQFVIPLHPRTKSTVLKGDFPEIKNIFNNPLIKIIDPVSFIEMTYLEANSIMIMTDSGGVQKEAYFHKKPCLILNDSTAWPELVDAGCAFLTNVGKNRIVELFYSALDKKDKMQFPDMFGDGNGSETIVNEVISFFEQRN